MVRRPGSGSEGEKVEMRLWDMAGEKLVRLVALGRSSPPCSAIIRSSDFTRACIAVPTIIRISIDRKTFFLTFFFFDETLQNWLSGVVKFGISGFYFTCEIRFSCKVRR